MQIGLVSFLLVIVGSAAGKSKVCRWNDKQCLQNGRSDSEGTIHEIELEGSWEFDQAFELKNSENKEPKDFYYNYKVGSYVDFTDLYLTVVEQVGMDVRIMGLNLGEDQGLVLLQDAVDQALANEDDKSVVGPVHKISYRVDPLTDLTIYRAIFKAPGLTFYSDHFFSSEQEKREVKITVSYTLSSN